jgi:NAD(P)-dependent dehydrogenase (short-subunit alcohol dehydrogenase family)
MLLKDKTALITGAGRGIGRGIALAFAEQGCDLALTSRTESELLETADFVQRMGRRVTIAPCDLSDTRSIQRLATAALEFLGHIDILVNNAGYAQFKPFKDLSLDEWQLTLDVNVTAPAILIQALLPSMINQGHGKIINISSLAGLKPYAEQSAYVASKYALNGLGAVLALELKQYNIHVHTVCPGGVKTRLTDEAMPQRDKSDWMEPEDIAHACLFLATQHPRATTDVLAIRRFTSSP